VNAAVSDPVGGIDLPKDIPYAANSTDAENEIRAFVRGGIRVAFLIGLIGVMVFFSIGGIRWIFSGGDKQKVEQAKSMITAAIVGFAILALSYIILFLIGTFFGVEIVQDTDKGPSSKPGGSCQLACLDDLADPTDGCNNRADAQAICDSNYPGWHATGPVAGVKWMCCP